MAGDQRPQLIWDLPLRLWHWALVICLAGSWITAEAGFEWTQTHFYFGYTALALVLFRLTWGVFGTLHSRYASFVVSPMRVFRYLKNVGSNPTSAGHNPLGGWASALIVSLIGLQASLGLFISDDIFYAGPYNSVVSDHTADALAGWHHRIFTLIQVAVVMHLAAVAWHTWGLKERLIEAMFHGKKNLHESAGNQEISEHRATIALVLMVLATLAVTALVYFAPAPVFDDFY